MLMKLKFLNNPLFEPERKIPFSEFAVMLMKRTFEIDASFEVESLGQVVT
jgi:hypothetical protein